MFEYLAGFGFGKSCHYLYNTPMSKEAPKHSLSDDIQAAARHEGVSPRVITDYLLKVTEIIGNVNRQVKKSDTDELGKLKDALQNGQ